MRLSQRADYAAHAMVEIARSYGEKPVHATEIAQRHWYGAIAGPAAATP